LLGAGLGTRLRPLTNYEPKPLVPFLLQPLLFSTLDRLKALGMQRVFINTHHLAGRWQEHFKTPRYAGMQLIFSHEPLLLDTGGGLKKLACQFDNEAVLVHNGDILSDMPLEQLCRQHAENHCLATLALQDEGPLMNVAFDRHGKQVFDMRHALSKHPGNSQFSGVYCLQPELLDFVPEHSVVSIVPAFIEAMRQHALRGWMSPPCHWLDIGDVASYFWSQMLQPRQQTLIHVSAKVHAGARLCRQSIIGAGAVIAEGCQLENCIVWPEVVLEAGCKAHNCIFLPGEVVSIPKLHPQQKIEQLFPFAQA